MTDSSRAIESQRFIPLDENDPIEYRFHVTHKTGTVLTQKFRQEWFMKSTIQMEIDPSVDEKTVVVVRDLFDATVSGYLYHKTGRECWLTTEGLIPSDLRENGLLQHNWTKLVNTVPVPDYITYPEFNLCQALGAAPNDKIGIGIYLEWARKRFYDPIYRLSKQFDPPTLSVCMEDMKKNPLETATRIHDFYVGTDTERYLPKPTTSNRRLVSGAGGHATDPDPVLRKRLYDLARELDCEYFGCETAMWNEQAVRCTSSINPPHDQSSPEDASLQALLSALTFFIVCVFIARRSRVKSRVTKAF